MNKLIYNCKGSTIFWKMFITLYCVLMLIIYTHYFFPNPSDSHVHIKVYAKEILVPSPMMPATPTKMPIDSSIQDIDNYITQVFGTDSDKAFKLLSCENGSHAPDTVNTYGNYPEGSRDIGVFQINEYWQGVNAKFLFNWRINIQIAKQLYDENGQRFNLWTCGKSLGI